MKRITTIIKLEDNYYDDVLNHIEVRGTYADISRLKHYIEKLKGQLKECQNKIPYNDDIMDIED
jgi:hypothetical protein